MELPAIKNFSSISKAKFAIILSVVCAVVSTACSHKPSGIDTNNTGDESRVTLEDKSTEATSEEEFVGPPADYSTNEPMSTRGWVVVLGPGMMRGAAYLGVFKALANSKIKINAIVSSELSAVYAAMFYINGRNKAEWDHTKITKSVLHDPSMFGLTGEKAQGKKIERLLASLFNNKNLECSKTKLIIGLQNKFGEPEFISQGPASKVLRSAVALEGIMKEGEMGYSLALRNPFPIDYARSLEMGKVLAVDVLSNNYLTPSDDDVEKSYEKLFHMTRHLAEDSLKKADAVLRIQTDSSPYLGIEKRAELVFRGLKATEKWAKSIRQDISN